MASTVEIANSSFLDLGSYQSVDADVDVATAYGLTTTGAAPAGDGFMVALVLDRANPVTFLDQSWGERQQTISDLNASGTLWSTYGASQSTFDTVTTALQGMGLTIVGNAEGQDGYVTSAESRTIWVELFASDFETLFGKELMSGSNSEGSLLYWNGNLTLPDTIASSVVGIWPDYNIDPAISNQTDASIPLEQGAQSQGNNTTATTDLFPQDIAALYNFPLTGTGHETGTIGVIEPGIGDAVEHIAEDGTFQERFDTYRATAGVGGTAEYYVKNRDNQSYDGDAAGERSLDVGIIGTVVPESRVGLYVGSGDTVFTSYQTAIWDTENAPEVISSSWSDGNLMSPDSPFYRAYRELFVDAALAGISMFNDAYDGGSGNETATGVPSLFTGSMSPYAMVVGGTSLSTNAAAEADTTLTDLVQQAAGNDLSTIWSLIRGGLTQWSADATQQSTFIETVWNQYFLQGDTLTYSYLSNATTSGGVDTTQDTPSYQTDFGIHPVSDSPDPHVGRGVPDVSANAGGNLEYLAPGEDMLDVTGSGGTSAATPLWASLATEINAIFTDQGLPVLGYANDLYYLAAAIAPASFNDITLGNNISSYTLGGSYLAQTGPWDNPTYTPITPTGFGYEAQEGYDLTTGLGSPNGVLLARALSTIAHSQMYFDLTPILVESGGEGATWSTGATESLLFQANLTGNDGWSLSLDSVSYTFSSTDAQAYAWTASMAQQSLQSDFSSALVTMFDGYAHSQIYQVTAEAGSDLAISIGGVAADAYQAALTSNYGFVDFATADGSSVEVARAVALATTAGGADDQDVVVRMRQNGMNDISVSFYEVDNYAGAINGVLPGEPGYAALAAAHAYATTGGQTSISGGGYGAFSQTEIVGVDAGDLVAMKITSAGQTYWAFASANEVVDGANVAHMWSYGLNTWGWEDLYGGGDHDYNDLVVQLDFTSASGSGLLV